jgi:hypothetical protein
MPETCRVVIPNNLEFSASVGFVQKEFVTMHGHTILKFRYIISNSFNRIHPVVLYQLNTIIVRL